MNVTDSMDRRTALKTLGSLAAATIIPGLARAAESARSQAHSLGVARSVRRWTAVQRLLDGYVSDRTVAGAAVSISYGSSPLAYPAASKIAFDSPVPFDENSRCRMYSITKNVTQIAMESSSCIASGEMRRMACASWTSLRAPRRH